jgi:hypothetical protein
VLRFIQAFFLLSGTLVANSSPLDAFGQTKVGDVQMVVLNGSCDKLTLGKKKYGDVCSSKILSTSYPDGRVGFYFVMEDGRSITFSGMDGENPTPDTDITNIDKVIANFNVKTPDKPNVFAATGKCSFGNPYKGKSTISCKGKLSDGRAFAGVFTTDGSPPN